MKAIDSRIRRLQHQLCPDHGQEQRLWVAVIVGREFALDQDRCIEILDECGFLPKTRFGVLSFCGIPDGLNAKELENYLRRNGTQTCNFGASQPRVGPGGATRLGEASCSSQAQIASDCVRC
jgi:hypothetical protein